MTSSKVKSIRIWLTSRLATGKALTVAVDVIRRGGGRLIVVDAIDPKASAFYQRHGFTPSPDPNPLMMKVSDAAVSIGLDWP
jgi:hypothetical protein